MIRATKETEAGRRYLDLQRKAKQTGRPTDELIQLYALEGLLDRLSRSAHACWDQFKKVVPVARITSAGEFEPKYFEAFSKRQTPSRVPESPPSAPAAPVNANPAPQATQPANAPIKPGDSVTESAPASSPA